MKRLIYILIIFCFIFSNKPSYNSVFAKAETSTYAKATANCTLYKSSNLKHETSNIYFIVPETYFVIILDKVSDECYKVQYDKFIGYVSANTIIIATFIPIVKTLENITVDIKDTSGTQIWNSPNTDGTILATISAGFKNIKYIAACYGTIPNGGESNLWYYVNYTPSKNSTNVYEGYIYSENSTNLSEIVANTESNPEIIVDNSLDNVIFLSSSLKTIIITIITIPIVIFLLIILYKSSKKFKEYTFNKNNQCSTNNEFNQVNSEPDYTFNHLNQAKTQPIPTNSSNSLKETLVNMKNKVFIRKRNNQTNQTLNYPSFPDYNDDDML